MLHQLDVWAYELVVGAWSLYWPGLLCVLALAPFERLFPVERGQSWRPWFFNLAWHAMFSTVAVLATWGAWWGIVDWLTRAAGGPLLHLAAPADGWGIAWRVLLYLLVFDFVTYWWHRAMHAWAPLWAIHRLHHDEEHMNASTSFRSHWLNVPFNQIVVQIPILWLLGIQALAPGVLLIMVAVAAVTHANLRIDLGPFTRIVVGPTYHRVHHDLDRARADSNFATFFPVWDLLFGTYAEPVRGGPRVLGISGMPATSSFWRANAQPFVDWLELLLGSLRRRRHPMG